MFEIAHEVVVPLTNFPHLNLHLIFSMIIMFLDLYFERQLLSGYFISEFDGGCFCFLARFNSQYTLMLMLHHKQIFSLNFKSTHNMVYNCGSESTRGEDPPLLFAFYPCYSSLSSGMEGMNI